MVRRDGGQSNGISRRRLLAAGAGVGGLALLGGAGSAAAAVAPRGGRSLVSKQAAAPSGEVRFPNWFGQGDIEGWNGVIELFKAVAPEVEVKFEPLQFEQYWQKFNTQLAAGDAPDACGMHVGLVYGYAEKQQLVELTPLIERDAYPLDGLFPNQVEEGRWPKTGGTPGLYMLPWRFVGSAFYVNKTLLDAKGIPMPAAGWTWEDWVEIAKATRDEGAGIYGSSLPADQLMQPQFAQAGAFGPLDETLTKSNFLDPGIQEAVQFLADLALTHKVAPRPQDVPVTGGNPQDLFLAGKAALHPSATWNIPAYRAVEFEWDVVPQPTHKTTGSYAGPDAIAIPAEAENVEAAWAFIKFATTDQGAQQLLGATGMPVTQEYALSEEYISGEASRKPASYGMLIQELMGGRGYGFNSSWFEWVRDSRQIFQQIYNGKVGVADGLKQVDATVTEILNRAQQ